MYEYTVLTIIVTVIVINFAEILLYNTQNLFRLVDGPGNG
jgi:hypothetical protein